MSDKGVDGGLSRRDFLKVAGTVVGGAALGGPFLIAEKHRVIEESGVEKLVTSDGEFFRLPDFHDQKYSVEELGKLPKLDGVLFESVKNQDELVRNNPTEVMESLSAQREGGRREMIPAEELDHFADNGAYIVVEGQRLSEGVFGETTMILLAEMMAGFGYVPWRLEYQKKLLGDERTKEWSGRDSAVLGWSLSPLMTLFMSGIGRGGENELMRGVAQKTVDRLGSISQAMHPEIMAFFLRNVNMARQQLLLADYVDRNNFSLNQPKTGYKIGVGHGDGIGDSIVLGREYVYSMLASYPRQVWQNMGELNGGREMLATTPLFFKQWGKWERLLVKDKRYEQMLLEKGVE